MEASPTVLTSRVAHPTGFLLPQTSPLKQIQARLVVSPIADPLRTGYLVSRMAEKLWVPFSLCCEPYGLVDGVRTEELISTRAIVKIGEAGETVRVAASKSFVDTFGSALLTTLKCRLGVYATEIASSPTTREDSQIPEGKVAYVVKFDPIWIGGKRYHLEALTFAEPYKGVRKHNHYSLSLKGITEDSTMDDLLSALATNHLIANPI
jgi:hypothetical protein